jgi:hypothetical protein
VKVEEKMPVIAEFARLQIKVIQNHVREFHEKFTFHRKFKQTRKKASFIFDGEKMECKEIMQNIKVMTSKRATNYAEKTILDLRVENEDRLKCLIFKNFETIEKLNLKKPVPMGFVKTWLYGVPIQKNGK